jgi:hypothetical protein
VKGFLLRWETLLFGLSHISNAGSVVGHRHGALAEVERVVYEKFLGLRSVTHWMGMDTADP